MNQIAPNAKAVDRPRLLLFPGSMRAASHHRRLVDYFAARLGTICTCDVLLPGEVDLPLFNQDLEQDPGVLARVRALHRRIAAADGLIVASPEYNGHVSPYVKNTLDWISRLQRIDPETAGLNPFRDKPLLLASASTGWTGGVLGLQNARSILGYLGAFVVGEQICVCDADAWCQGDAFVFEPAFAVHIDRVLAEFVLRVDRLRQGARTGIEGEATRHA